MSPAPPAIALRDLRKLYGEKAAVDGLTLTVPAGSFFGFLGPNGAGKTTTIRMLMGVTPPTSGSIEILGLRMPDDAIAIKKRIGVVPDESLLFDRLTGGDYLEFAGRIYGLELSANYKDTQLSGYVNLAFARAFFAFFNAFLALALALA